MRLSLVALSTAILVILAGCSGSSSDKKDPIMPPPPALDAMNFTTYVVPAVHQGHGLYEPTIDVSPEGTIYISSHSTGVGVGPAPGYYSVDDGATWTTLALAGSAALPPNTQGSAPLFSDEIFIVAGADGEAWGVDINLRDYIVTGWCGNGAELCYYNPNAYDHTQIVLQAGECIARPLKDRPWAAYSNGTLLLVNNPGGGPAQVGSMTVPPSVPVDAGHVVSDIQWNLCASSGGFIPGIPDIRPDGFFAVPQTNQGRLKIVTGYASDVMAVQEVDVMAYANTAASEVGQYGQAVFDATGTLFVGGMNNNGTSGEGVGGFRIAVSSDALNFTDVRFAFDQPVSSIYLDGNKFGEGALINWGLVDTAGTDWYFGHLFMVNGKPVLKNVYLAVDDGPAASRHVQGAAAGPDGRAYMVMSEVSGNDDVAMAQAIGTTPISVVVQTAGVTLPVA